MTIEARRHRPRVRLGETAYINFASGICGVILDVSEGGLGFKTSAPVEASESAKFWLTFDHRSEALAEVAWTDPSRTTGGLRFITVPSEVLEQIRTWLDRPEEASRSRSLPFVLPAQIRVAAPIPLSAPRGEQTVQPERPAPVVPMPVERVVEAKREPLTIVAVPKVAEEKQPPVAGSNIFASAQRPILAEKQNHLSMFPLDPARSDRFSPSDGKSSVRHRLGVGALLVLLLLGAASVAASYFYPHEARNAVGSVDALVARFLHPNRKQPVSDVEPAAMGAIPQSREFAGAPLDPATAHSETAAGGNDLIPSTEPRTPLAGADAKVAPTNHVAPSNSDADLALAQSYLSSDSGPAQKAKAVQLLWLATEKGNVDAELQLADLYLQGEAVQKSCVQARILLKAAATANPALAQPKLAELDASGCD